MHLAAIARPGLYTETATFEIAQACRLGLEVPFEGVDMCIIAAADTVMERTNEDLVREVFPGAPTRTLGDLDTLLSISKAATVLGYRPRHSWRPPT